MDPIKDFTLLLQVARAQPMGHGGAAESLFMATCGGDAGPRVHPATLCRADVHGFLVRADAIATDLSELLEGAPVALCFHWQLMRVQVRIEARIKGRPITVQTTCHARLVRCVPHRIEFWKEMPGRLHFRRQHVREGECWREERLFP